MRSVAAPLHKLAGVLSNACAIEASCNEVHWLGINEGSAAIQPLNRGGTGLSLAFPSSSSTVLAFAWESNITFFGILVQMRRRPRSTPSARARAPALLKNLYAGKFFVAHTASFRSRTGLRGC